MTLSVDKGDASESKTVSVAVDSPSNTSCSDAPSPIWLYTVSRLSPLMECSRYSRLCTTASVRSRRVPSGSLSETENTRPAERGKNSVPTNGVSRNVTTSNPTDRPITHQRRRRNEVSSMPYRSNRTVFACRCICFLPDSRSYSMGIISKATNKEDSSEKATVHACSLNSSPDAPCR